MWSHFWRNEVAALKAQPTSPPTNNRTEQSTWTHHGFSSVCRFLPVSSLSLSLLPHRSRDLYSKSRSEADKSKDWVAGSKLHEAFTDQVKVRQPPLSFSPLCVALLSCQLFRQHTASPPLLAETLSCELFPGCLVDSRDPAVSHFFFFPPFLPSFLWGCCSAVESLVSLCVQVAVLPSCQI